MAGMQNECGETAGILESLQSSEKSSKNDRGVWLNAVMEEMEDSLKCHRQGDFFRKLRDFNASRVKQTSTILDEHGQPIKTSEERLLRWKRLFERVLNVPSTVVEEVIADVEARVTTDTTEVTREEVVIAVI